MLVCYSRHVVGSSVDLQDVYKIHKLFMMAEEESIFVQQKSRNVHLHFNSILNFFWASILIANINIVLNVNASHWNSIEFYFYG